MSEAELIASGFLGIQTRMTLWETEFTLIFAYIAALYFFLRHTTVAFRSFTFAIFVLIMSFMWIGFAGTDIGSERYLEARTYSIDQGLLPPHWSNAAAGRVGSLLFAASALGHLLHGIAVAGCFYVTYFYRWQART